MNFADLNLLRTVDKSENVIFSFFQITMTFSIFDVTQNEHGINSKTSFTFLNFYNIRLSSKIHFKGRFSCFAYLHCWKNRERDRFSIKYFYIYWFQYDLIDLSGISYQSDIPHRFTYKSQFVRRN